MGSTRWKQKLGCSFESDETPATRTISELLMGQTRMPKTEFERVRQDLMAAAEKRLADSQRKKI